MERGVEDEVPHQAEAGQLGGLGQQHQGRLGLQEGGDDPSWVAVEETQEEDRQRVGPPELVHLLSQGLSGGQAHHGAGGHPQHREQRGRVENLGDRRPHGEVVGWCTLRSGLRGESHHMMTNRSLSSTATSENSSIRSDCTTGYTATAVRHVRLL